MMLLITLCFIAVACTIGATRTFGRGKNTASALLAAAATIALSLAIDWPAT